ncbi:glycoside hydrolase family 28 protein [Gracilinema caldarium]|uniref:Polygalacturonase n=1 Tax=Gracilinema caldarium (strain ATCC 51460 / DSM 7334 / H1) TaxID=744872 RepID=F8F1E4_GRAC1|nr:glycoside hydrolase family 28 protein [Gracilinema caldarium]AEJ18788.1 Polygalacturonase [Gracilinema caldarium DSM 7334]
MEIVLQGHQNCTTGNIIQDDSILLRSAIKKLTSVGGGILKLTSGVFFSGPLQLYSNIHLYIEENATLTFNADFSLYKPVWTRWEGVECWAMHPLIFASKAENITIAGSGHIDGNGEPWWNSLWQAKAEKRTHPKYPYELQLADLNKDYRNQPSGGGGRELQFLRPPLIQFLNCKNITLQNVTLQNSPFWNTHFAFCSDCTITGVHFINPKEAPNTDGLNIDSCSSITIQNCTFDVGDDCLGLKSGSGEDGIRINRPTENILIDSCTMKNGHGGVVIGSETAGGINNIKITNCSMEETDRGLRIKTRRGRGGVIENIRLEHCYMKNILCPLVVNCYYGPGGPKSSSPIFSLDPQPLSATTPKIQNIYISHLIAEHCRAAAAFIVGLPEQPIKNLYISECKFILDDINIQTTELAAMYRGLPKASGRGVRLRNINGIIINQTKVIFPTTVNEMREPYLLESNIIDCTLQ